jgi:hypothetical protein
MRRYSGRWTQIGLFALFGAACGPSGGGTDSDAQVDPGTTGPEATTTPGPVTEGSATGQLSGDSDSEASPTTGAGVTETSGASPTTGDETTEGTSTTDPGDTTDDSGTTSDTGGNENQPCALATMHLPCDEQSDDPLHAMGLNCTSLGGDWSELNAVPVANFSGMQAAPPIGGKRAWRVVRSYGTYIDPETQQPFWGPREGDKVLLISSGLLPEPDAKGGLVIADGDVYNDVGFGNPWDSNEMPPPMKPNKGSPDPNGFANCDGVNDCSNTLWDQWQSGLGDAEDKMWFSFELTAPAIANGQIANANGYSFDFAFFSAEFPEWVGHQYNDIFVVWQASEDYTGNVTFINDQPLTVTALWPVDFVGECDQIGCQGADPHLAGTGYIHDGGATGWYKATGGVNPGETFTLAFGIFDMGDSIYDTTAILDNWLWDCKGCVPNEVNSCGVAPQ